MMNISALYRALKTGGKSFPYTRQNKPKDMDK